jgi:ATP-dependent Clp protease ATP-binding subunit ClpA
LLVALVEQWEPVISSAVTKLGHDSDEVLRGLSARLIGRQKTPRRKTLDKKEEKKKDSALRRFGRDLTEMAAKGCLPPLIGRRAEMLKITQILLQNRKSNLILVGEPGVGKTGIVEGFAQLLAEGKLPDALGRPAVRRVDTSVRRANGWRKKSGLWLRTFASHWHVGETPTLLGCGIGQRQHGRGEHPQARAGPWRDPGDWRDDDFEL